MRSIKRADQHLQIPSRAYVAEKRKALPHFTPVDLQVLMTQARRTSKNETGVDAQFMKLLRERLNEQLRDVVRAFDVEPSAPEAWKRAFIALASIYLGAGHVKWSPPKTNRNAASWTLDKDATLAEEVLAYRDRGLSDRKAIREIARDPKKRALALPPRLGPHSRIPISGQN